MAILVVFDLLALRGVELLDQLLAHNEASWPVTMTDAKRVMVANPIDHYSLRDRSGLAANPDGSIDTYIQASAPPGHEPTRSPTVN